MLTVLLRYTKLLEHIGQPVEGVTGEYVIGVDPGKRYIGLAVVGINKARGALYGLREMRLAEVLVLEMKATNAPTSLELSEYGRVLDNLISSYGVSFVGYETPVVRRIKEKVIPSSRETWEVIGVTKERAALRTRGVVTFNARYIRSRLGSVKLKEKDLARRLAALLQCDLLNGMRYDHGPDAVAVAATTAIKCLDGRWPIELHHDR